MARIVRMPALAAGATEAAIQAWLVAVGDEVEAGQGIVEIETEKAVVEQEVEDAGVVAALLADAGATVAVGAPLAIIAGPGESAADALAAAGVDAAGAPAASQTEGSEDGGPTPPEPVADLTAAEPEPEPAAPPAPERAVSADERPRLFASPLVRRLAKERGVDLAAVRGSGPQGRIVRRDLDRISPASVAPQRPASPPASGADGGYTDVPHTPMRRAIARRLTESVTTVPHFFLAAECRVDELLAVRARINEGGDARISVNDFVLKAVASAMGAVPEANAVWLPEAVRRFDTVDVGVAVSIPGGLVTPVVRGVERIPLGAISATVRDLAERAREGRLKQHELEGGSFAVSNLGMYGTREFSAIINPPHAGILAVGAAERRPVVGADGALTVASVMSVTLSADHRVLDGALAAQWLAAFVTKIENPLSMLI